MVGNRGDKSRKIYENKEDFHHTAYKVASQLGRSTQQYHSSKVTLNYTTDSDQINNLKHDSGKHNICKV